MKNQLLASFLGLLLACLSPAAAFAQVTDVVCMNTNLGEICIRLFPQDAPNTVANFLKYVNDGDYNGSVIHRSEPGFVIQGGGYTWPGSSPVTIPKDPNVVNEFRLPNTRGSVAMAKVGGDPNSANSEWYINLAWNTNLDSVNNNGGYTVFGEVVIGMSVVDQIAALTVRDISSVAGGAFARVPLVGLDTVYTPVDFVTISRAYATQRDLTPVPTPEDPFPGVVTVATYNTIYVSSPVQWTDGKLYRMLMVQDSTPPPDYLFKVDTAIIVQLKDKGQPRAIFDGTTLTIPSVRSGGNIFTNVRLQLTDRRTLQFKVVSYTPYTGEEPL